MKENNEMTNQEVTTTPPQRYIIVSQVKSNRIVYFTTDTAYVAPPEDWFFVSSFQGTLPSKMTLANCWRWRFNGGVFTDTGKTTSAQPSQETLIENNRKTIRKLLEEKIDGIRRPYIPSCIFAERVRTEILSEAYRYLKQEHLQQGFPYLSGFASARGIGLEDAASRVINRESEFSDMLQATEAVLQKYTQLIIGAKTNSDLAKLRDDILNNVAPDTSQKYRYKPPHVTPINKTAALHPELLEAEKSCLRATLKQKMSSRVLKIAQHDFLSSEIHDLAVEQAKEILTNPNITNNELEVTLVTQVAGKRNESLKETAAFLINQNIEIRKGLTQAEIEYRSQLKNIEKVTNLQDINAVYEKLKTY